MKVPTMADYVETYFTLFERFQQGRKGPAGRGRVFTYEDQILIVFFTMMIIRRIVRFKAQHRWLGSHPREALELGFEQVPHRSTMSRRFKDLDVTVRAFIVYVGWWAEELHPAFSSRTLVEDASLFKAQGPVWHQSDRKAGRIPEKLRNLDTDASWRKSAYHGWVYGYGLHLTCNRQGFPKLAQVETACVSESQVLDQKTEMIFQFKPQVLVGDNSYFKAMRIRNWAKRGVILLSPATKWKNGRYARAYHRFIKEPLPAKWLACRKTAIEPIFDLFAKVLGTTDNHKQLPLQRLDNVRTFLCLGVLAVQIAMIVNNTWGLPLRQISNILTVFS